MTRRERLENKLAKRQEWAAKAEKRSHEEMEKSMAATAGIPLGQPILVGHHSEKRHRAVIARAQAAGNRAIEESNLSKHHREKAAGLSDYLESTIFDDDPDAIKRIQQKIDNLEKQHALMLAVNKVCRNKKLDEFAKISAIVDLGLTESAAKEAVHPSESWQSVGFDSYVLSNNKANIRRYKERLVSLKRNKWKIFRSRLEKSPPCSTLYQGRGNPERSGGRRRNWLRFSVLCFSGDWAGYSRGVFFSTFPTQSPFFVYRKEKNVRVHFHGLRACRRPFHLPSCRKAGVVVVRFRLP